MPYQILIYSPKKSNRLKYVLDWIFSEQLNVNYKLTNDLETYLSSSAAKINYSTTSITPNELHVVPESLLFETDINNNIPIRYHRWKHSDIIFYNQPGKKIPFDVFAAVFFFITRYEEYITTFKDKHHRFQAKHSVAYQYSFLQSPVVDIWIKKLEVLLSQKFNVTVAQKQFSFLPTYDVDMVWAYQNKTLKETLGGAVKDMLQLHFTKLKQRIQTLQGKITDPYFSFADLEKLHQQFNMQPLFFILSIQQKTNYDKNTPLNNIKMKEFVQRLSEKYTIGVHPSYFSHSSLEKLQSEIDLLQQTSGQRITKSRQHFIKFSLPETYRQLIRAGIDEDYSMGYATDNGFRAGTSNSFLWYDIQQDTVTNLRVFPFVFMEATSLFYKKQTHSEVLQEWERLLFSVKQNNGMFISIFHNYTLGTSVEYQAWYDVYRKMLLKIQEQR